MGKTNFMNTRRTKIICTIAGNRCDVDFLKSLHDRGMNIVRINSAHSTVEGAQMILDNVRKAAGDVKVLIDTKGPEVRLTETELADGIYLKEGVSVEFRDNVGFISSGKILNTNCSSFVKDVPVGASILIDDGTIRLTVIDKDEMRLICIVDVGGILKSHKGINVPNVHLSLPALTERDRTFITWAVSEGVDYLAHSFVRAASDLHEIREVLGRSSIKLISKIENQQGIDNIEDILMLSYGIMIARGDLGVEVPMERLPVIQRDIVRRCQERDRMVIIATQMLHTMIDNPRPTRAEISDVANAIFQHVDAVMLSGETANGKYPLEAVDIMRRTIIEVEKHIYRF